MGNTQSIQKINYEDIQTFIQDKNTSESILINTMQVDEQKCLIPKTCLATNEEIIINELISESKKDVTIFIYGKNSNEEKIYEKYNELKSLGFQNVYLYVGGLFEWLLLQDIYGDELFPTTCKELDIIKYKPNTNNVRMLRYS